MILRHSDHDGLGHSKLQEEPTISETMANKNSTSKQWYSVPAPVRRVFNQFPLVSYEENTLPQRARRSNDIHKLYVFANVLDTSSRDLSCNPTCLKWQAYLKFNDIDFLIVASNNHAAPSGSLPFVLPASSTHESNPAPLSTGKIARWVSQQTMQEEDHITMEQEAYMALVDQNLRNAWLYHLYLDRSNFAAVARPLYVCTSSTNPLIQIAIAHQLREAAQSELLKTGKIIDRDEIFSAAAKAFKALSTLLGTSKFFSKEERPSLFDASVFAYTYLLLDYNLPWRDTSLCDMLRNHPRLLRHRERILNICTDS